MKKIIALCCMLMAAITMNAQEGEYREMVKELIQKTGVMATFQSDLMVNAFSALARQQRPELTQDQAEGLTREYLSDVALEDMTTTLLPMYESSLSKDEMRRTIDFFNTPMGQSISVKLPKILSMENMQTLMAPLAANIDKVFKEEPYELTDPGVSADYMKEFMRLFEVADLASSLNGLTKQFENAGFGAVQSKLAEYLQADMPNLICLCYANIMTKEELMALADFYATPEGKKVAQLLYSTMASPQDTGEKFYQAFLKFVNEK